MGCRRERIGLDVDGPIRAAGERLTDHLRRPGRPCRYDDHLAGVFFLETKRLLERIGIRLVQFEARVLIPDPGPGVVDPHLVFAGHDLFDANSYLHAD